MKTLILFAVFLALTGCVSDKNKVKTYRTEIEFYKPEKLKVLYSMPEEKELPEECYKINFPSTIIAKVELQSQKLRNLNKLMKQTADTAKGKLKNFEGFLAQKKAEISEQAKLHQQIKEMEKELKEINTRIHNKVLAPCFKNNQTIGK